MEALEGFVKVVGSVVIVVLAVTGLALLGAYPTKWIMNYLFNPALLQHIFTVSRFDVWHAFCLNYIAASLIKSTLGGSK